MTVLLVIDMQVGLFGKDTPRYDAEGVVDRIDALARGVRQAGGLVVFVQHDGPPGDTFEPGADGWRILPSLERQADDPVVHKRACDAFYETDLATILQEHDARQLFVTGCATDFCVDTTVRAAASRDYELIVVEDGHTTADRPRICQAGTSCRGGLAASRRFSSPRWAAPARRERLTPTPRKEQRADRGRLFVRATRREGPETTPYRTFR